MVSIRELGLERVFEVETARFADDRGFFTETYNRAAFREAGITEEFVQDNMSLSVSRGTLRGLHFQAGEMAQAKLVRVLSGSIFDVAVDIRPQSPDYRKWVGITLSAERGNQILVPRGFAHGFVTLEPDTLVAYKVDNPYSRDHDRSIRFDDPSLGIDWPKFSEGYEISQKDRAAPLLDELAGDAK